VVVSGTFTSRKNQVQSRAYVCRGCGYARRNQIRYGGSPADGLDSPQPWRPEKAPVLRHRRHDNRSPRDGRIIERIGLFNPVARGQSPRLRLDLEKVEAWVARGAQLSDRVASLVKEQRRAEQSAA